MSSGARGARLSEQFGQTTVFDESPLYKTLVRTAGTRPEVLELVGQTKPGQQPTFLLLGAVHSLLLSGTAHRLREYYASVVGRDCVRPAAGAAEAFIDFCSAYSLP